MNNQIEHFDVINNLYVRHLRELGLDDKTLKDLGSKIKSSLDPIHQDKVQRKRKPALDIIRAGDDVIIKNPEFVLRCGYPMTLGDYAKDPEWRRFLDEFHSIMISYKLTQPRTGLHSHLAFTVSPKLCKRGSELQRTFSLDATPKQGMFLPVSDIQALRIANNNSRTSFIESFTERALYAFACKKNFGGDQRSLHTELLPDMKDRIFRVVSKKRVITGRRVADKDGSYLADTKTHVILDLGFHQDDHLKISQENVLKVVDGKALPKGVKSKSNTKFKAAPELTDPDGYSDEEKFGEEE